MYEFLQNTLLLISGIAGVIKIAESIKKYFRRPFIKVHPDYHKVFEHPMGMSSVFDKNGNYIPKKPLIKKVNPEDGDKYKYAAYEISIVEGQHIISVVKHHVYVKKWCIWIKNSNDSETFGPQDKGFPWDLSPTSQYFSHVGIEKELLTHSKRMTVIEVTYDKNRTLKKRIYW